jgi:L-threonylcarbamoyladenylate synthase
VLKVDPRAPEPDAIRRAADVLRAGGLVAFPTETVYGLGANALDAAAVGRIFTAKGRPATNPVIVHVADAEQVGLVVSDWPRAAAQLAAKFWPGPLTVVVAKWRDVPDAVTAGGPTVGVRCPAHPVARELIRAAGVPVAAPSANRSTELSPTRAEHVLKGLGGRIDLVLDGGPCPGGIESTVVDATGGTVRLLRPGLVTVPMLEAVVGPVEVGADSGEVARSPGLMTKHYSPRTPVVVAQLKFEAHRIAWELCNRGFRVGLYMMEVIWADELGLDSRSPDVPQPPGAVFIKQMPADPEECAATLYDTLHEFDAMNLHTVVIDLPLDTPEWSAVRDRLMRAAGRG